MKISRDWLQTYFAQELPDAPALADALTFHAFEIESVDPVQSQGDHGARGDWVLDVKVTPNRGHDCLSYRGIAKEVSAILNIPIRSDPLRPKLILDEETPRNAEESPHLVSVEIKTPLCARYIAGYIRGVKVGPSPEWLRKRLESIGQKSINNIVDATNFVMFNLGQPLHAFDAGKLEQVDGTYAIDVRKTKGEGKMLALDEKEYTLPDSTLIIADANKNNAIGIAGVKGGLAAQITSTTRDVVVESANFDGVSVRRTAAALKLRTDASSRFEQVISPELAAYGMNAAVELITQVAGGEVIGFADEYPASPEKKQVAISTARVNGLLGTSLKDTDVANTLERLDLPYQKKGDEFTVQIPFERLDLTVPEDLVEEVARIVGYDKIPSTQLASFEKKPEINSNFYAAEHEREKLVAAGYSEVFTSVFADKGERAVANKVDGARPYLRATLIDGLSEALERNVRNKDLLGLDEIRIFEIGTVWKGGKEMVVVGMVDKVEVKESPLPKARAAAYENLPLSGAIRYQPFSKYPFIIRDIALWVSQETQSDEVLNVIKKHAGEMLARSSLFDRFEKNGKLSLAFRLVFQSFDRTLTDAEANGVMERVNSSVQKRGWQVR